MKILILSFKKRTIEKKQLICPLTPIKIAKNKRGGIMLVSPVCPYFLTLDS